MKLLVWTMGVLACGAGWALADAPAPAVAPAAGPALEELTVDLTCILPAAGPAVERGQLVARLYEYDPRLADRAAAEIARVVLAGIVHRPGTETVLRFPCAGKTPVRKAYYLTAVLYPEGAHEQAGLYFIDGFQRVLAVGPRQTLRVTLTPVDAESEPTN